MDFPIGHGDIFQPAMLGTTRGYMGVSKNRGTPKWMVKIMENPIKMDDLGVPLFSETSCLKILFEKLGQIIQHHGVTLHILLPGWNF